MHIVGCPRSGTTLLLEMMAACFDNAGHCQHELDIFQSPEWQDGVFITKQPSDIRYLHTVFLADPALFVIYMVRDPRSVVASVHPSLPDRYFVDFADWEACQDAAELLNSHQRFLELRYEELVDDPNGVQSRIAARFPWLKRLHDFSDFHRHAAVSEASQAAMHGLRPVEASRIASWREHLPRIRAQLLRYPSLPDDLIRAGYEADDRWTAILEGVEPVWRPGRHRKWCGLRALETRARKWRKTRAYLKRLQSGDQKC